MCSNSRKNGPNFCQLIKLLYLVILLYASRHSFIGSPYASRETIEETKKKIKNV